MSMRKIRIRKHRVLLGIIALLFVVSIGASFYFFHVAQIREEKSFINNNGRSKDNSLYAYEQSFDQLTKETLWMTNQGLKQDAWYVPAETATNKTVIVVHGFTNDKEDMKPYAWMFHELGYNVLMPDNMSHGDSEGQIIGYGWNDRLNVIKWAEMLVEQNSDSEITLFGVSMGGATVMMASGEETLPKQVVNIVEDCGYSSVWDELNKCHFWGKWLILRYSARSRGPCSMRETLCQYRLERAKEESSHWACPKADASFFYVKERKIR